MNLISFALIAGIFTLALTTITRSPRAWRKLKKDRSALFSGAVIVVYALAAITVSGGIIATETDIQVGEKFLAPCAQHLLGTDRLGRDIFTRVVYANKIAFMVGIVSATAAVIIRRDCSLPMDFAL